MKDLVGSGEGADMHERKETCETSMCAPSLEPARAFVSAAAPLERGLEAAAEKLGVLAQRKGASARHHEEDGDFERALDAEYSAERETRVTLSELLVAAGPGRGGRWKALECP